MIKAYYAGLATGAGAVNLAIDGALEDYQEPLKQDAETLLTNYEEIITQLANYIIQFEKDLKDYQTDVYLYIDENGKGELDLFPNPGGRSWRNDKHYVVYSDPPHNNDPLYFYDSVAQLADQLKIPFKQLEEETRQYLDLDPEDGVDFSDAIELIRHNDTYKDKIIEGYEKAIEDTRPQTIKDAAFILQEWYKEDIEGKYRGEED